MRCPERLQSNRHHIERVPRHPYSLPPLGFVVVHGMPAGLHKGHTALCLYGKSGFQASSGISVYLAL
ncbi:Uncharacterised protein [Vibrio cholerae]|nr:Uncharacterised protein [Vibrio cholerae]